MKYALIKSLAFSLLISLTLQAKQVAVGGEMNNDNNSMAENNNDDTLASHGDTAMMDEFERKMCPLFDNCLQHQVTYNYTHYGCSQCEPEYLLLADFTGAGVCKQKNILPNCLASQVIPSMNNKKPICWKCEKGYYVQPKGAGCAKVPTGLRLIDNCIDYLLFNNKLYCNTCEPGYTASNDGTRCTKGCSIENCETCSTINNKTQCWMCKPGYIAVFDGNMYNACISCKDWHKKLIVSPQ